MPIRQHYFLVCPDDDRPLTETEYPTPELAEAEAKRLEIENSHPYDVHHMDRMVELPEELASKVTMYLLTCEICNGEYGTISYRSLHSSLDGAKAIHQKVMNPEDLKGEDAINEWREDQHEKGVIEFRTGNWGFVVWEIRELKLLA